MAHYRFERSISSLDKKWLKIRNRTGKIDISGTKGTEIKIIVQIEYPGSEVPQDCIPEITELSGGVQISTKELRTWKWFNGDQFFSQRTQDENDNETGEEELGFEPSETFNPEIKIDLSIAAPENTDLQVQNVNGPVFVKDFGSEVHIRAVNGSIQMQNVSGDLKVRAVNGPISSNGGIQSSVDLKTVNGPIKYLPEDIRGKGKLRSVNGPIRVIFEKPASLEFSVRTFGGILKISNSLQGTYRSSRRFEGSCGQGQHQFTIRTFSGPISIQYPEITDDQKKQVDTTASIPPAPVETPIAIIDRMVLSGQISREEANRLRKAVET